jgi:hypothetical protein
MMLMLVQIIFTVDKMIGRRCPFKSCKENLAPGSLTCATHAPKPVLLFTDVPPDTVSLSPFRDLGSLKWANVMMGERVDLEVATPDLRLCYNGANFDSLVGTPGDERFAVWIGDLVAKLSEIVGSAINNQPVKGDGNVKMKIKPTATLVGVDGLDELKRGMVVTATVRFGVYRHTDGATGLIINVRSLTVQGQDTPLKRTRGTPSDLEFDII